MVAVTGEEVPLSNGESVVHPAPKPSITLPLIMSVTIAVIGLSFQYGYNMAVVNAPADEIKDFFFRPPLTIYTNASSMQELNGSMDVTEAPAVSGGQEPVNDEDAYGNKMYAVAVSVFPFTGTIGSLLIGTIVRKSGIRGSFMVCITISCIAATILGFSKLADSFAMIVIGRAIIGVFAGLASGIVPMYVAEISPKEYRGAIGVVNQLLVTIGILVARLFSLQGVMDIVSVWPYLFALTAVPSLMLLSTMPLMPKSPQYLFIDQHEEDEAKDILVQLRGTEDVAREMNDMQQEADSMTSAGQMTIVRFLKHRAVRWQLIIIASMMIAQQFSGFSAVFFYSDEFFKSAGILDPNQQNLFSVGIVAVSVIVTIISCGIIERTGRKSLLVCGFGQMAFWLALMEISNQLEWISTLRVCCVFGYIIGFATGPGPIPWLLTAELFQQVHRPAGFMVACFVNWGCYFLVGIAFQSLINTAGFWVFVVVCASAAVFLTFVLPETGNKTFKEINDLFAKKNEVEPSEDSRDSSGEKTTVIQPIYYFIGNKTIQINAN